MNTYPEYYNLCLQRHSCRSYSGRPVGRDLIDAAVDAARLAPSACNRQPWRFVAVDAASPATMAMLHGAYPRDWFRTAPVCIVAIGLHHEAWHRAADGKDATDIDTAIATEHLVMALASLGIASCWVCNFDTAAVARALALAPGEEPVALIPAGYPEAPAPAKERKPLDSILQWAD